MPRPHLPLTPAETAAVQAALYRELAMPMALVMLREELDSLSANAHAYANEAVERCRAAAQTAERIKARRAERQASRPLMTVGGAR